MPAPYSSSTPSSTAAHLSVSGVSKSFADRRVLSDVNFTVPAGDRAALIGENGSGKSTLLRIIAGVEAADAGEVRAVAPGRGAARIGLLHQEPPFSPEASVAAAVESAIRPIRAAEAAVDRCAAEIAASPDDLRAAEAYARALDTAERLGVWEIDARVDATLDGVGLGRVPQSGRAGDLSGGQRARLSLAWLLLNLPDVLILDEPTNHLDDQATEFLRGVLAGWRGPVLFASHDRAFLDESATSLIDLDPSPQAHAVTAPLLDGGPGSGIGAARFTGGFSDYLAARAAERRRWEQRYRDEQTELARLRAAVGESRTVGHADWKPRTEQRGAQKFYADRNAKVVSRRVNDARSRLEGLEQRQIGKPPAVLRFIGLPSRGPGAGGADEASAADAAGGAGAAIDAVADPILSASEVAVAGRLAPVSLSAGRRERWLLTGPNGAGKSTLLHTIAGHLRPSSGSIVIAADARVGLLEQEVALPEPHGGGRTASARAVYAAGVGIERAETVPLSTFGLLSGRDERRAATALSVGQQRRLALAIVLAHPPDVLLLDEPTNHLSLTLVEELEAALEGFGGVLLIASHDRRLRSKWAGETLELGRSRADRRPKQTHPRVI